MNEWCKTTEHITLVAIEEVIENRSVSGKVEKHSFRPSFFSESKKVEIRHFNALDL